MHPRSAPDARHSACPPFFAARPEAREEDAGNVRLARSTSGFQYKLEAFHRKTRASHSFIADRGMHSFRRMAASGPEYLATRPARIRQPGAHAR